MAREANGGSGEGSTKISFYPGCSLTSSAKELGESFEEMAHRLSMDIAPLDDWNCCGSSPAHSTNHGFALLLAARNLLLAEEQGVRDLYVMCPSCFVRLREAQKAIGLDDEKKRIVENEFGRPYEGRVRLRFFLEIFSDDAKREAFKSMVVQPLQGIKGAMYYGCLLSRPEWITGFDVTPYEAAIEEVVVTLGAESVRWSLQRQCCGAHLAVTKPDIVDVLIDRIRDYAIRAGANCMVSFCPLCQMNLELRGKNSEPLPVFYISELFGLAARLPKSKTWLKKHLVDPIPLLSSLGIEAD